jgi:hypothetical protein
MKFDKINKWDAFLCNNYSEFIRHYNFTDEPGKASFHEKLPYRQLSNDGYYSWSEHNTVA